MLLKSGDSHIPLLSPKPFGDYTPEGFREYVRSLYVEPPRPAPLAEYAVRLNDKGNPVITVRRKPKYLTRTEIFAIATELGWKKQLMWAHLRKKKMEIR